MTDFTLEPDDLEPDRPERRRPVRLVSTLAPTAELPQRRTKETPPCYVSCTTCGALVLTGRTSTGVLLALDVAVNTYVVDWQTGTPAPRLIESRAYPLHRCPARQPHDPDPGEWCSACEEIHNEYRNEEEYV